MFQSEKPYFLLQNVFFSFLFFSIVFAGTEVSPYWLYSPLPPLRGQPTGKCHPRWQPILGLAVHCRLGRVLDLNPGLQFRNLVSLPMSHHCSPNEPPLPPPMSHHCSPNEPPLPPPMSHHCSPNEPPLLRNVNFFPRTVLLLPTHLVHICFQLVHILPICILFSSALSSSFLFHSHFPSFSLHLFHTVSSKRRRLIPPALV
jgi:hypothetical protein